jgi:HEAT repeat protein
LPAQEPANPPASDSAGSVPLALQELWALSKAPAEQAESKARVLRATYLRNVLLKTVDAELDKLAAPYAAKLPEAGDEGPSAFPAGGLPLLLDAISRVEQAAGWLPDTAKKCAQVRERAHGIVSGATALSAWGAAYRNEFWRGFWAGPSREHLTIIAYLAYAADSYPGALAGCSESDLFVSVPDADWWDVVYALGRVPVKGRARLAVSVSKERKVLQSVDYTEVLSGSPHSFSRDQVTVTVRLIRDGQTVWQRSAAGADPNWRVPLPGSLRVAKDTGHIAPSALLREGQRGDEEAWEELWKEGLGVALEQWRTAYAPLTPPSKLTASERACCGAIAAVLCGDYGAGVNRFREVESEFQGTYAAAAAKAALAPLKLPQPKPKLVLGAGEPGADAGVLDWFGSDPRDYGAAVAALTGPPAGGLPSQTRAIELLAARGGPEDVLVLCEAVRSNRGNPLVQDAALAALVKLGDPRAVPFVAEALVEASGKVNDHALAALLAIDGPSVDQTLLALAERHRGGVRAVLAGALRRRGHPLATELLRRCLADSDQHARSVAAEELARGLGPADDEAIDALAGALADKYIVVRTTAATALVRAGSARCAARLLAAARARDGRWVLFEVRGLRNPEAVPILVPALEDKDPEIMCVAAAALGNIGDAQAVEPLIKALEKHPYKSELSRPLEQITGQSFESAAEYRDWWEQHGTEHTAKADP